jgi:hypothetical protein
MKLKSFGCSFVYGCDLDDAATNGLGASPLSWPALLAQRLGLTYECHAFPGIGNLQILQRLLQQLQDPEPAVHVVSWTWIDRFDYQAHGGSDWNTIRPTCEHATAQHYYRNLHSQYRDQLATLTYMTTALTVLQKTPWPWVFVCMDDLVLENCYPNQRSLRPLQNLVRPTLTDFDGTNFLQWSRQQEFAISAQLHPLQQAHQAAADLIYKKLSWQHREF